jgi:hypothetical protein
MAGIDATIAQSHLDAWLAADLAVAQGRSYTLGNRSLTRADEGEIRANIAHWDAQVKQLARGASGRRLNIGSIELG